MKDLTTGKSTPPPSHDEYTDDINFRRQQEEAQRELPPKGDALKAPDAGKPKPK